MARICNTAVLLLAILVAKPLQAQDVDAKPDLKQKERFAAFEKMLEKTAFVGHFMVDGDENENRRAERYEIRRVEKQPLGDYWIVFARITYGDHDVTVPVPVEIKWAGSTPVITVDEVTIPGLGTFDARVVVSDNKYAGTWRHGKVGGLMFGHIEKQKKQPEEEKKTEKEAKESTE